MDEPLSPVLALGPPPAPGQLLLLLLLGGTLHPSGRLRERNSLPFPQGQEGAMIYCGSR